ncbi:DinB family protein [Phycicoccus sp. Soil748]|uniref:DinB family protein n=1 Tax=Phycicoccus sp. Soil748 TaxID=1736397 RepID=UPI0009EB9F5F|nr:DinB family protein [Phycicoccus sp. Soil748]
MSGYDDSRRGEVFRRLDLSDAVFDDTYLTGARFRNVDLRQAVIRGSLLLDVEISGEVERLTVNGVDVTGFVEAELDRRDPDRTRMHPTDPAGFREAWDVLERRWSETVDRARRLESRDPALLHERVDGEWSFVETLRHLVFATDAWIRRALLGDPAPWSPLDLPHDDMADIPSVPRDHDVRPSLDEVLELRRDRMATVREVVDGLTDERLAGTTTPVTQPGYPESESFPVSRVVGCIVNEEWHHHAYATRDLAVLESRLVTDPQPCQ